MELLYFILGIFFLAITCIIVFGVIFYRKIQNQSQTALNESQKILNTVNLRFQRMVKQVGEMDNYAIEIKEALKQDKYISLAEISNEIDKISKKIEEQEQILNVTQSAFNEFVDRILNELYEVKTTGEKKKVPVKK